MWWVSSGAPRLRRAIALAAIAGGLWLASGIVVPWLVTMKLRSELAARGFPDARFRIAGIGPSRIALRGVVLDDELELGDLDIEGTLWRWWSPRIEQVSVRGASLPVEALERFEQRQTPQPAAAGSAPFEELHVTNCTLVIAGHEVRVSGRIALGARMEVDLAAHSAAVRLGSVTVRGVEAYVRGTGGPIEACASGRVGEAAGQACTTLPGSRDALGALRVADVTWRVRGTDREAPWSAAGRGTVRHAPDGGVFLDNGHVELDSELRRIGSITIERATLEAEVTGRLFPLRLEVRGLARAGHVVTRGSSRTTVRDASAAFSLQATRSNGALALVADKPVIVNARLGTIRGGGRALRVTEPSVTLRPASTRAFLVSSVATVVPRTMSWRARHVQTGSLAFERPAGTVSTALDGEPRRVSWHANIVRWSGARFAKVAGSVELASMHTRARWASVRGPGPLVLGRGEVAFRTAPGRLRIDGGRVAAGGGELSVAPFVADLSRPTDLVLQARGLVLGRVLAPVARGRVEGTGTLDGEIALRLGDTGATLTRGTLRARRGGRLRIRDPQWRARLSTQVSTSPLAIHERIAGAIADLEYTRLVATIGPHGSDPEVRLSLRGRGHRPPHQVLDLTFNLRGVRDAATRLSNRATVRTP